MMVEFVLIDIVFFVFFVDFKFFFIEIMVIKIFLKVFLKGEKCDNWLGDEFYDYKKFFLFGED